MTDDLRISVIGLGKLGAPMLAVLADKGYGVVGVDLDPAVVASVNAGRAPVAEPGLQERMDANRSRMRATTDVADAVRDTDLTFMIVPTPSAPDHTFLNDCVVAALKEVGAALRHKDGYHNVVCTSTVMPGATGAVLRPVLEEASGRVVGDTLGLCYNPEFIALGTVVRDMLHPDMVLIGESDDRAGTMLESVHRSSVESSPQYHRMNWVNAELCKIAVNTYVTTKISYANMIADLCDHLPGADANVVTRALGADSRIGPKYIRGAVAYGGPCFPRDNKAFAALARGLGARADLAEATDRINDHQTTRLLDAVASLADPGAVVAVLGIAYKPDTPVHEASQGLTLATELAARGYAVRLTDPAAVAGPPGTLPAGVSSAAARDDALRGAEVCVIMTPWAEYREGLTAELCGEGMPAAVVDPWRVVDADALPVTTTLVRPGMGGWRQRVADGVAV